MLTAAGIAIPVMIHLWNRRQGKTRKVASIMLLQQSFRQQAKKLQLQDLLLLFLRALLIALVALGLSGPVWRTLPDAGKQKGWILMDRAAIAPAYARFKPLIDSLTAQQYTFHYFEPGFPEEKLEKALTSPPDSGKAPRPYWALLQALDRQVPASLPVYLFTPNTLPHFTGARPAVALNLRWHSFTQPDSVATWLTKAYPTGTDSLRVVTATSRPSGTTYSYASLSAREPGAGYTLRTGAEGPLLSYGNGTPVPVDTGTLHITLYTDQYQHDITYLKAALEAVRQFSRQKMDISVASRATGIKAGQDWLFWLSGQPLPAGSPPHVFRYAQGKVETAPSTILTTLQETTGEDLALYRRTRADSGGSAREQVLWKDGFGNPLLEREEGPQQVYRFYSRFDPAWSELPWSGAFPQMMHHLLLAKPAIKAPFDKRILDNNQIAPLLVKEGKADTGTALARSLDLSAPCWFLALLVFFVERALSFRTRKEQ